VLRRIVFSLALVAVAPSFAAENGTPVRPLSLGNWYDHDPVAPQDGREPWTAADVAGFLALYPNAFFELGYGDGKPAGNTGWLDMARRTAELRSLAASRGVDTRSRLCIVERPDIMVRNAPNVAPCTPSRGGGGCDWDGDMDGRHGEAENAVRVAGRASDGAPNALVDASQRWLPELYTHRLLVLRPGGADEERRRVAWNDDHTLGVTSDFAEPPRAGDAYEIRATFDEAWIKRIPIEDHRRVIQRFWEAERDVCDGPCNPPAQPLDPFESERGFESWVDGAAIRALRTPSAVPALWGYTMDEGTDPDRLEDPYYRANSVVMDVADRQYRAWRARYMLYKLEDYGFQKSDGVCLFVGYKPGAHVWHDPAHGVPTDPCSEPDTNAWFGPAQVCADGTPYPGALHPAPFRRGEFENGISAYFRELVATLSAAGWNDVRIITSEAPNYMAITWYALGNDVRHLPQMYGEQGGFIHPPLAELAALEDPDAGTGSGADPDTGPGTGSASDPSTDPGAGPDAGGDPDPVAGGGAPSPSPVPTNAAASQPTRTDEESDRGGFIKSGGGGGGGMVEPPDAN